MPGKDMAVKVLTSVETLVAILVWTLEVPFVRFQMLAAKFIDVNR